MLWLDDLMRRYGEVASVEELNTAGISKVHLELLVGYGKLKRVRRGYYALPGHPAPVLRAWSLGGKLACASALAHLGEGERPATVHVLLPRHLSRGRLERAGLVSGMVLHWNRVPQGGDRVAVSPAAARRQAQRCTNL